MGCPKNLTQEARPDEILKIAELGLSKPAKGGKGDKTYSDRMERW